MSNQRVLVTYAPSLSSQTSDSWVQILTALRSQLPLHDIHWKSASRPSFRTIQELDISLVALDSLHDEHTSQIPVALLEKPLLNLYIAFCEDAETYKLVVKKQIKDWQTSVTQRRNQEWLIIHVIRPDVRTSDRKFFNMKGSVLDKLKADFNTDKRERCIQLAWSAGEQNPAVWMDLISKIKDGLLSALDITVSSREEEVKRSESQRHMPGWNFCTYFILKESLATSFEGICLFEDAVQQYNELEVAFMSVLREKNMSWFGSLIHPTPKDDSAPLLSTSKKPYRDLILANTISVFDLRVYLLARQSTLLSKLRQPVEICRKAMSLLSTFGKRLREVERALPEYFVESWIFTSAISVVDQCDSWASSWPEMDRVAVSRYCASKGELLELAKTQLDILGIRIGHLPSIPPFSMAMPIVTDTPSSPLPETRSASSRISKHEIVLAVCDREAFYDLYCTVSNRAIDMYVKAGRRKFALKLHGCLATLDIHRGRLDNSLTIFSSLPAHYAPHMWTSLESFMLSRAIETHEELKKPHNREWVHIMLAFLKTYMDEPGWNLPISQDVGKYIAAQVTALRKAAENLDSDLDCSEHPAMRVSVAGKVQCSEHEDLLSLAVIVHNRLPCEVDIDEVGLMLTGTGPSRVKFATKVNRLIPGRNHLTLTSPTSSYGTYVLESTEVQMSHIRFYWNHKGATGAGTPRKHPVLLHLPRNPESLGVQLRLPQKVVLGASPQLQLEIFSGRNDVSSAMIKMSAPSGITFKLASAQIQSKGILETIPSENGLSVSNLPRGSNAIILIPHSDASRFPVIKVHVSIIYKVAQCPTVVRTLQTSITVTMAMPLTVNVEDFFRGEKLFSKFTMTTLQHVRISSAKLLGPSLGKEGVKILECQPSCLGMTAAPDRPVSYIFCIESEQGPVADSLEFLLSFRLLCEEIEALVDKVVQDVLHRWPEKSHNRRKIVMNVIDCLERDSSWAVLYNATGQLVVPSSLSVDEELREMFASVQEILSMPRLPSTSLCPWREISIPVDIPRVNVVAEARIAIHPSSVADNPPQNQLPQIYAGQPVPATLYIKSSLYWSDSDHKQMPYRMRYDVKEQAKDWLICGRKRGEATTEDGQALQIPITLIAMHHGHLPLPKVDVRPLPMDRVESVPRILPTGDIHQSHGAETVLVLPRGGRSTFIVNMGAENM